MPSETNLKKKQMADAQVPFTLEGGCDIQIVVVNNLVCKLLQ